jgi:IS5 family transposase
LGLSLGNKVPDAKTIRLFRDALGKSGADKKLFALFTTRMEAQGVITRKGSIVDASFVDVPRQRNSREENQTIKKGGVPQEWAKPENTNKLEQKDTDARWAKKNNETHYGYKDHVKVDADSKMIVTFGVTNAAVHDSQKIVELCDEKDEVVNADSAYVGENLERELKEKCGEDVDLRINEKGYRNKPLVDEQKEANREKSRIRARVEHVFGHITNSMGGMTIRCIGLRRARCTITLMNLAYNLSRYAYLSTLKNRPLAA